MGHLLWWCVIFVLGTGILQSESSLWIRQTWICLTEDLCGRQRLRSLRPPFQVGNGYFYYFICLLFQPVVIDLVNLMYYFGFCGKTG